ncbi:release factor glutamine methyltransferase [Bacteroidia bacterium]|nr:release factor glutamine methyltransferase [Bacteroidia bacterium]
MQQLKQYFCSQLAELYSPAETDELFFIVLKKWKNIARADFLLNKKLALTDSETVELQSVINRLKKFEPIQYILGETEFFGMKYFVNQQVLIPRPETEELVEWILAENKSAASVLDIGTGSGCIAVVLAHKNPRFALTAMDISEKALAIARKNAALHNVKIDFLEKDIFSLPTMDKKFDIIVSNPPYIPENEKNSIQKTVMDFEPHTALFVPDSKPLIFYEKICQFAKNQLNENGKIYFEIHRSFGQQVVDLLQQNGFKNIALKTDISGNERMVRCEA